MTVIEWKRLIRQDALPQYQNRYIGFLLSDTVNCQTQPKHLQIVRQQCCPRLIRERSATRLVLIENPIHMK